MSATPAVSVVLTTHNRPVWLAEALGSVLTGKFQDYEVIVSNNGDPQDTRRLRQAIDDPRIRWLEQDQSLGMIENMLAGLARARGKYAAFLHDDDRWSPNFLAVLTAGLERYPQAWLAFCDHEIIDARGRVDIDATDRATRTYGRADLPAGLVEDFLGVVIRQSVKITGCVWRRESLPVSELTPAVAPHLDVWLSYLLARDGAAAFYSPERLMSYRMHAGCHSASRDLAVWLAGIHCQERMLDDPILKPYAPVLRGRVAGYHRLAAEGMLRQGMRRPARKHLAAAMAVRPTARAVAGWAASWVMPTSMLARM